MSDIFEKRPKICVVGAGGYGGVYINGMLKEDLGGDLVGACDVNPDMNGRREKYVAAGIPLYTTLEDFYQHDTADLVVIASPIHFHRELTELAFAHGSNVLCEKPLALDIEDVVAMQQAADKAGKFLSVGYQNDYRKDVLAVKKHILQGVYGKPIRLGVTQAFRRGEKYYHRNNWAGHISVNGREVLDSPFANASAHSFQMMTFVLGKTMETACDVTDLQAELYHGNPAVENFDIAAMRFATDVGAQIYYYTAHPIETVEIGPKGVWEFENGTITFQGFAPTFMGTLKDGTIIDYSGVGMGHEHQKLIDAIECVKNGGHPVCTAQTDFAHIHAVRMAQQLPIETVRDELRQVKEIDGDTFTIITGLENTLFECLDKWALPSEIGRDLK